MKKETEIRILKIAPMEAPVVVTLPNELHALQQAVSIGAEYVGYIECVGLDEDVDILCNEEAKLIGLTPNRRMGGDVICGVFYVIGVDEDTGEFRSLADAQIQKYATMFQEPEIISPREAQKMLDFFFFT